MKKLTNNQFIEKAKKIHGEKYDYSKVEYINNRTKVCIICPIHGEFWQTPNKHLLGSGCQICGNELISIIKRSNKIDFINKANFVHNHKYDYSKVEYVNARTKVCIICPEHGEFWQTPDDHLHGKECPFCKTSKIEKLISNVLCENNVSFEQQKKFEWLGKQSLDFYLPDYNIAIECQGKQHFEAVEHFGGLKGFKKTLLRDKKKRKLCKNNNIGLLYYSDLNIDFPYEVITDINNLINVIKNYAKS